MSTIDIYHLGTIDYKSALYTQLNLLEKRINEEINDSLLLLEHPPTITMGRSGKRSNLLISDDYLKSKNIEFFETSRGGDITFHGPGQIVCYPIINLNHRTKDVHKHIRDLEEIIIETLREFQVEGQRVDGLTGVWTNGCKIASIGVGIRRWTTYHGFAVNVNNDLDFFDLIIPCGITDVKMTSIKRCNGPEDQIDIGSVGKTIVEKFTDKFKYSAVKERASAPDLSKTCLT